MRRNPSPYKKKNSAEYLADHGTKLAGGPWTTHETCLLFCVISLIGASSVSPTVNSITILYNNVVNFGINN